MFEITKKNHVDVYSHAMSCQELLCGIPCDLNEPLNKATGNDGGILYV